MHLTEMMIAGLCGATNISRKPQAASRKPQAASRKPQAASRKPQAASQDHDVFLKIPVKRFYFYSAEISALNSQFSLNSLVSCILYPVSISLRAPSGLPDLLVACSLRLAAF
jgi:hypothetical protein